MAEFKIEDLIAALLITGGIGLKAIGQDGVIDSILVAITGFYFGYKAAATWKHRD